MDNLGQLGKQLGGEAGQAGQGGLDSLGNLGDLGGLVGRLQQDPSSVSNEEASQAYGQVAKQLPPDQMQQAAMSAFQQLSPDQRAQFVQELQAKTQASGGGPAALQQADAQDRARQDPGFLAGVTSQVHQQQPDMLQGLLGSAGSNPVVKTALTGIVAAAAQRFMGGAR